MNLNVEKQHFVTAVHFFSHLAVCSVHGDTDYIAKFLKFPFFSANIQRRLTSSCHLRVVTLARTLSVHMYTVSISTATITLSSLSHIQNSQEHNF